VYRVYVPYKIITRVIEFLAAKQHEIQLLFILFMRQPVLLVTKTLKVHKLSLLLRIKE